jgi:DNA helicase II / ATP-dependent DNA helicase PcrA
VLLDDVPLNPEQRQAALHFEGPLLVLAGAGSGKTRVLAARVAHLIAHHGVAPDRILCLTFTNKAAHTMRERITALLGRDPAGMWVGTFHAIGARILRRDATRLGWAPNFVIYDADDSEQLIRRIVRDELQLDPKRWTPRAFRAALSQAKNELTSPEQYAAGATDLFERHCAAVYGRYQAALRDANAFDFDDLLVKPVELFRGSERVLQSYRERFQFVLVDEYQDTNRAQYAFLRLISASEGDDAPANLFVVGDDDQSIYGWRGADLRNILEFEKDFPAVRVVRLERNYRSTRTILEAANLVIAQNRMRKGKTLRTEAGAGEPITLLEAADELDEAEWITSEIQRRSREGGVALREMVVLYRTNAQSRALEEALLGEGIPYRVVGGTRFYERREVKDMLAYLRLVANPRDDASFLRVVNLPRRGVGDTSVARLAEWARERGLTLLEAARRVEEVEEIRGAAARGLEAFAGIVGKFAALAEARLPLDELLRLLVVESGVEAALRQEGDEGEERLENLTELIAGAGELESRMLEGDPRFDAEELEGLRPLDAFLAHVALVTDVDQHDPTADVVSLMTLHNCKGLEYPVVFIAGLEEGLFPLARAYDAPEQLEEERRLFYVGVTRAERKLFLTCARRRRRGAEWMDGTPSSFLEPLPRELLELLQTARTRQVAGFSRGWRTPARRERLGYSAPPAARQDSRYEVDYSQSQEQPRMVKGARVRHPTFGAGTVTELSGGGRDLRATIDFDAVGRKQVVLRYANLEAEWEGEGA